MYRKLLAITGMTLMAAATMSADFSYQESSKVTGGVMAGMLKVAGVFSKAAREPIVSTIAVKGDRMARRSSTHSEIIDLSKETITSIDMQKKTYSVVTFAEMKQMMEELSQKLKNNKKDDAQMSFKVSANATGNTRNISGFDAKEMLVKIAMEATDQKSGQKGGMVVTSRVWVAPDVRGYSEVRDFQKKMAEKMNWSPGGNMFMANPEVAKGMAEVYKEVSKLDGAPVLQVVSMGPEVSGSPDGSNPPAAQQQQQQQPQVPSVGGALGGALGGKFGLGRKKNQDQQPAGAGNTQAPSNPGSLIDMTTESSNFSTAGTDPGMFEVPAGFKKVEPQKLR